MTRLNHAVRYGLISGLILIVFNAILYIADVNLFKTGYSLLNGVVVFGVMIYFTYLSMQKSRDLNLGGKISYVQALGIGFVMLIITGYLTGIFSYLLNAVIDPDYITRQIDTFYQTWDGIMSEEALDMALEKMESSMKPSKALLTTLYMTPITSLIISALIALFVRKDNSSKVQV
ncbi:MAG: DUF4199 domain-containing protein [Bacteroidales bacterium]|jgi:hypothetical protein|nr:DUF4199 domain-containing protein [Bacteroidales bacterium]MCK9448451.1 DUF4199 domain-containing protein [Bacteroidales bacterium]MDD3701631.1 DUF4199 domain-containing protein [Bacteroidales bacterium]MDY0369780.1 DUF4199 domain-containing protein [Bacteroidales bacterium]